TRTRTVKPRAVKTRTTHARRAVRPVRVLIAQVQEPESFDAGVVGQAEQFFATGVVQLVLEEVDQFLFAHFFAVARAETARPAATSQVQPAGHFAALVGQGVGISQPLLCLGR